MNFTEAVIRSELIWIPPVNTFNAAEVTFLDAMFSSADAHVEHTGVANYVLKAKIDTICIMDVVNFPFDVQYCNIDFDAGISYNNSAVVYKGNRSSAVYGLPEWSISQPKINSILFPADGDLYYPCTLVTFKLTRNPQFYVYFLVLPTITLTLCCMAALLLPLEIGEGERVNLGIAGLLGLTFMLSIIVVQVPRSETLPLMGKWLIVQMFYCIGAMLWEVPSAKFVQFLEKRTSPATHKQKHIFLFVHICSSVLLLGSNVLAETTREEFLVLSPADQLLALEIETEFLTQLTEQMQKEMDKLDILLTTLHSAENSVGQMPKRKLEGIKPNMVAERLKLFETKK